MTIKSNTPAPDKDCWQTPLWLFDALDIEFGFWLDSAASDKNALCAHWLTESDDALNSDWISHGAIWNNPPYSNIRPWVEKAAKQCIQQRQTVVMLVPEDIHCQTGIRTEFNSAWGRQRERHKTGFGAMGGHGSQIIAKMFVGHL